MLFFQEYNIVVMYNDDFNDVNINYEKDGFSSYEFGNVQDSEFTFFPTTIFK